MPVLLAIQDQYGKESSDRSFVKLPLRLFRDYTAQGSLHHILSAAFRFQEEHNVDLSEENAYETVSTSLLSSLLQSLEKSLLEVCT